MTPVEEASARGELARVRHISDDGQRIYAEFRNAQVGWVGTSEPVNFARGEIVLILPDRIERAPVEAWDDDTWVGVVRLKLPDLTIIESGGQVRQVPTRDGIEYRQGNTVEARSSGVVRVLSDKPIRFLDLPEVDDADIGHFLVDTATIDETFADFGGPPEVIKRAQDLIVAPLRYRDALREIGAKTIKGILFTGPPGTGKTMLARIIAREAQAVFYKVSGPEIFSKWYGQSEEMLRKLFEHASRQPSAIIFFDEIDSVAGQRDEEAHEASKRVVAQLLTLMDGFKAESNVVVIATTNRPQDIDKALLRPGRFDREIYFPLPDLEDRELILRASARGIKTVDYLPHALIAEKTGSWSPAELAAIWTEAAHLAAADGRRAIMAEDYIGGFERVAAHLSRPSTASSKEAA